MATVTSNASCNPSSISVSGKNPGSGTISWSLPTVPAGGVISSCKLTGTCTITDSGNKPATVTVNGTSVSSGVAFAINLGTGNTTSSVAVVATGPHKNTNSTITFSNLVYTVDYETNVTYTVTFKDWDGTVLNTQTVKEGSSATAPDSPTREGYRFTGWDVSFNNIISDLTVTAQYKEIIEKAICIYSFDSSIDTLPVFNDGYEYRYTDVTNSDGTITRTIFSDIEPTIINFQDCTGLKTLDYMDLTNLIDFDNMFNSCTSLTTVKLENCPANANTVNNFQSMFAGCTSLTHAYISGINFENAQYMNNMFHSCSSLEYVDFGNFNSMHELDFASTFFYNTTRAFTTVVVDNPPANSMNKLIGLLPVRVSTLPSGTVIHNATDTSEWDIETLNSRNWQLLNNNLPRYTVTFKDWDGTVLKTEQVIEGASATAPSNPSRDGYEFTGWDTDFTDVRSDLTVTAQYSKAAIESITLDKNNIVLNVGETTTVQAQISPVQCTEKVKWSVNNDNVLLTVYNTEEDDDVETSDFLVLGYQEVFPTANYCTLRMTNNSFQLTSFSSSEASVLLYFDVLNPTFDYYLTFEHTEGVEVEIRTEQGSLYTNGLIESGDTFKSYKLSENTGYHLTFYYKNGTTSNWEVKNMSLVDDMGASVVIPILEDELTACVTGISEGESILTCSNQDGTVIATCNITVKIIGENEEPDNNELVQGDISEDGTFNDESTTVVRTKYIDISDKKSIQVNVLTDNVYISACYLYNANKELVKVIEIPADKKRKFGVNLQELIAQIIEDEGSDQ